MLTYLGMTAPMAVIALVSWLRNPYHGNKAEVKVNRLKGKEIVFFIFLNRCNYHCVLLYPPDAAYGQFDTEHPIGYHQLSGCLSNLPKKRLVCGRLCGKRYCIDRLMDIGGTVGFIVCICGDLLYRVFHQ